MKHSFKILLCVLGLNMFTNKYSAELYYVTSNDQKFATITKYLQDHQIELEIEQAKVDVKEIQSDSQEEVAIDKANKAFENIHVPVLVDDEGMFLDEYPDYPGVYTKDTMKRIGYKGLSRFLPVEASQGGTFKVTLVYKDKDVTKSFEASIHGTIVIDDSMLQDSHASFAKCFIPDGAQETYEALRGSDYFEKYYNFRAKAFKKFLEWYESYNQKS